MKNVLIVIVISVLAFSLNAHAQDFSITIDAEMDAWYYNLTGPDNGLVFMPAACHVLDIGDETTWPDDNDDLSAIVWFAYDDDYMYVYAEVTDDLVMVTSSSRWLNDCIELKFDPDPSAMSSGPTDNTRLSALSKEQAAPGATIDNLSDLGSWVATEGVDYARRLTDDGYVLEFRLPLDYIETPAGSLRENETGTFGMAINICENDDVDRTAMLQWSAGHTDAVHPNPALHGSVTFMENHILKLEAVSPQDPSIVNENADEWYLNPNVAAWAPSPADGSIEVPRDIVLSWRKGKYAITHDVYFGTDVNNVNDATIDNPSDILVGIGQEETTYDPPGLLDFGQTYYWRVDEINDSDANSPWKGDVWSFTALNYLVVVDDFEDYNDFSPDEIWNTWIDGYGDATNGSTVGDPDPDFNAGGHYVETDIVHSGEQSMPLFYNNTAGLSEATRALNADWTQGGVVTLTLFYYGDAANAVVPMYVALNGNAVVTNDNANAVLVTEWTKLDIPLQAFADQGVNLANVASISIGLGNKANTVAGGSGVVYFDDIRLYLPEPQ